MRRLPLLPSALVLVGCFGGYTPSAYAAATARGKVRPHLDLRPEQRARRVYGGP